MINNISSERFDLSIDKKFLTEKHLHHERYYLANGKLYGKKNKILDIACGTGYGCEILAKANAHVTGVDIDKKTVLSNKQKYKNKNINFVQGSITKIPFKNDSFELITSFETIEHITLKQGKKAAKELYRVAKPGATCFVSSPNAFWMKFIHLIKPNPFHLHEYNPGELKKIFEDAGWKTKESYGQLPFFPPFYPLINHGILKPKPLVLPNKNLSPLFSFYFVHVFTKS
jgi:2-polyprenyl-3-methyl-5-hydroxy-6-metoxy-1,4-benzoquinol methylase